MILLDILLLIIIGTWLLEAVVFIGALIAFILRKGDKE